MPFYENVFIVRPDASPQQVEALAGEMETVVREHGGQVPKTEIWGLKSLAYRIKKNRKGHYVFMNVEASTTALGELERNLRFNEDVLRYMSTRVSKLDPEASPMMRNKSSRDDRSIRRNAEDAQEADGAAEAAGKDEAPAEAGKDEAKPDETSGPEKTGNGEE